MDLSRRKVLRGLVDPSVWQAPITLDRQRCLAWSQTMCEYCTECCPESAIVREGLMKPTVDLRCCTRCGLCVNACPVSAIEIGVCKAEGP